MKETKIYADEFCTTFASTTEMLEFLAERAKQSKWIRKPTRMLKLVPLEKEAETIEEACEKELEGIVEDTEKNTQLVLKVNKDFYPVRDCAIHTILKRAGINGTGLKKLEKATYAKVVNYCLQVAKGDALIKVADGKVSAVHGGDDHDYCVLDMQTIFNMTSDYLKAHFKGSTYLEGSGSFDHSIVSAMWTLGGNQELLDTYHQALEDHGIEDKSLAPALRLTTSDVAVSGVNLYPMMLSQTSNRVINLGSPIKLSHDRGATLQDFRNNLDKIFSRYQEAVKGIVGLMDIDIQSLMRGSTMRESVTDVRIILECLQEAYQMEGDMVRSGKNIHATMIYPFVRMLQEKCRDLTEEQIHKTLWKEYEISGADRMFVERASKILEPYEGESEDEK